MYLKYFWGPNQKKKQLKEVKKNTEVNTSYSTLKERWICGLNLMVEHLKVTLNLILITCKAAKASWYQEHLHCKGKEQIFRSQVVIEEISEGLE